MEEFVIPNSDFNEFCSEGYVLNTTLDVNASTLAFTLKDCDDVLYSYASPQDGYLFDSRFKADEVTGFIKAGLDPNETQASLFVTIHDGNTAKLTITLDVGFFMETIDIILIVESLDLSGLRTMIRTLRTDFEYYKSLTFDRVTGYPVLFYERRGAGSYSRSAGSWYIIPINHAVGDDTHMYLHTNTGGISLKSGEYIIEAETTFYYTGTSMIRIVGSSDGDAATSPNTPYKELFGTQCHAYYSSYLSSCVARISRQRIIVETRITLFLKYRVNYGITETVYCPSPSSYSYVASVTIQRIG